jgi:Fip1 motif
VQVQARPIVPPRMDLPPEFPGVAAPDQLIKLPRQTKVQQSEYKEFLALGHGDIFDLDITRTVTVDRNNEPRNPPWSLPGADLSDFFNYGMDPESWRFYCAIIEAYRCRPRTHALHALRRRQRAPDARAEWSLRCLFACKHRAHAQEAVLPVCKTSILCTQYGFPIRLMTPDVRIPYLSARAGSGTASLRVQRTRQAGR